MDELLFMTDDIVDGWGLASSPLSEKEITLHLQIWLEGSGFEGTLPPREVLAEFVREVRRIHPVHLSADMLH